MAEFWRQNCSGDSLYRQLWLLVLCCYDVCDLVTTWDYAIFGPASLLLLLLLLLLFDMMQIDSNVDVCMYEYVISVYIYVCTGLTMAHHILT